jgi:hypothetical protein
VPAADWVAQLESAIAGEVVAAGGTYGIVNSDRLLARMIHAEILERHGRMTPEVDFLGSFNLACRKDAFEAAGGFDEAFRAASGEDNDLSYRLADAGGGLRFVPGAVVAHHHPERLLPYLRTQARHGYWRMKLYAKHPRRAGGDRYAGALDLAAVAVPWVVGALLIVAAAFAGAGMASTAAAASGLALAAALPYLGFRGLQSMRLAQRTGEAAMLLFAGVAVLRDAWRGAGLMKGFWWFMVMRRSSA